MLYFSFAYSAAGWNTHKTLPAYPDCTQRRRPLWSMDHRAQGQTISRYLTYIQLNIKAHMIYLIYSWLRAILFIGTHSRQCKVGTIVHPYLSFYNKLVNRLLVWPRSVSSTVHSIHLLCLSKGSQKEGGSWRRRWNDNSSTFRNGSKLNISDITMGG